MMHQREWCKTRCQHIQVLLIRDRLRPFAQVTVSHKQVTFKVWARANLKSKQYVWLQLQIDFSHIHSQTVLKGRYQHLRTLRFRSARARGCSLWHREQHPSENLLALCCGRALQSGVVARGWPASSLAKCRPPSWTWAASPATQILLPGRQPPGCSPSQSMPVYDRLLFCPRLRSVLIGASAEFEVVSRNIPPLCFVKLQGKSCPTPEYQKTRRFRQFKF